MEVAMNARKAAVVTLLLLLFSDVKANSLPVGTISSCTGAAIHGANLVPGTTIFSGDKIDVGAQGNVYIAVRGGGQVEVFENSTVLLTKSSDSIRLRIDRGQAKSNTKGVVINSVSSNDEGHESGRRVDRDKHKDRDCEVSKDSRKFRPCRDDID